MIWGYPHLRNPQMASTIKGDRVSACHADPCLFSAEHPTTQKANTRTSCFRCLCVDMCVCDHIWTPERPHRNLKQINLIACRIHLQCTRPYVLSKGSKKLQRTIMIPVPLGPLGPLVVLALSPVHSQSQRWL